MRIERLFFRNFLFWRVIKKTKWRTFISFGLRWNKLAFQECGAVLIYEFDVYFILVADLRLRPHGH
jgi:hypothetical protein